MENVILLARLLLVAQFFPPSFPEVEVEDADVFLSPIIMSTTDHMSSMSLFH